MRTDKEKRKRIFVYIAAGAGIIALSIIAIASINSEHSRSRDIQVLSEILNIQTALTGYAALHGVYPSIGQNPFILTERNISCLISQSESDLILRNCLQQQTGEQIGIYYSLAQDDGTLCTDRNGCQSYAIEFTLQTGRIASKGIHRINPSGFQ